MIRSAASPNPSSVVWSVSYICPSRMGYSRRGGSAHRVRIDPWRERSSIQLQALWSRRYLHTFQATLLEPVAYSSRAGKQVRGRAPQQTVDKSRFERLFTSRTFQQPPSPRNPPPAPSSIVRDLFDALCDATATSCSRGPRRGAPRSVSYGCCDYAWYADRRAMCTVSEQMTVCHHTSHARLCGLIHPGHWPGTSQSLHAARLGADQTPVPG